MREILFKISVNFLWKKVLRNVNPYISAKHGFNILHFLNLKNREFF